MNKPDVNAKIIRWILLLQQFDLTIIDKPGKEYVVEDFMSILTLPIDNEEMVDYRLPNEHMFSISMLSTWFDEIANYFVAGRFPPNLSFK